jgi:hypothetical protein
MPSYSLADTHNVALVSLSVISPQPRGEPVAPIQRNFAISSIPHDHGKFAVWHWSMLETEAAYLTLLTTLGLHNASYNDVTIYTRNERMVWTRYNARATLPLMGDDVKWQDFFVRGLSVTFTRLEAL